MAGVESVLTVVVPLVLWVGLFALFYWLAKRREAAGKPSLSDRISPAQSKILWAIFGGVVLVALVQRILDGELVAVLIGLSSSSSLRDS